MNKRSSDLSTWILGAICLLLSASLSYAAKPDKTGGSSATTSAQTPEIFWSSLDYVNRTLTIYGKHLIAGDVTSPEIPEVRIGGELVAIDDEASVGATDFATGEGPLIFSFDEILSALSDLIVVTPQGNELPGKLNFAIKIVATGGTVSSSSYFVQAIVETTTTPPTTGTCPCTAQYDEHYDELYALVWPTCTAPGSSNPPITGTIAVERYIDASYINELVIKTISIGSDSSTSPRSTLAGTCHVRTGDYWPLSETNGVFLETPIPVSDEDHMACVADIIAREAICRGGNWLDP